MIWPVVELIEAAARCGVADSVAGEYARLAEMTSASGSDRALGLRATGETAHKRTGFGLAEG
jgi:hypothetical protein